MPQTSSVGAYRIRPNAPTHPRRCFQGVCDTPLHRLFCGFVIFFVKLCVRCDEMFLIYDFKTHEHGIVFLDGAETVE